MRLKFTKMNGLGNDFVVIDAVNQSFSPDPALLRRIADRHTGIGCDQILVVRPARLSDAEFAYHIYNADGTEVEQCGNGARCFAKFVRDKRLTNSESIVVETLSGNITLAVQSDGDVTVNMGVPRFDPPSIPLVKPTEALSYSAEFEGQVVVFSAVNVGNPHAVIQVPSVNDAPVAKLGATMTGHEIFPQGVNVGFMQVIDRKQLRLRVYERGVGETRACGTGACAAMVVAHRLALVGDDVVVSLPGGELTIAWGGLGSSIKMTGPADTVFEGEMEI